MADKIPIDVVLPKRQVAGAKSRQRPFTTPDRGAEIRQLPQYNLINNTARNYREAVAIVALIRHLSRSEGQFSTAVHNMTEVASTKYKVFAYDAKTHEFSASGTSLAMSIIAAMDTPMDYSKATQKQSIDSLIKILLREAMITGGIAAELVLSKALVPDNLQVIGIENLTWIEDGEGGFTPQQTVSGQNDPVDLNIPTFFWAHLHPDPDTVSPRSMVEAAIKMLVYFDEFMEDIRRSVRIAGHNRLTIGLDSTRIKETAPREVQNDAKKLAAYMDSVRDAVKDIIENLEPEEALVFFDTAKAETLQSGTGTKIDYTPLLDVIAGQYATSLKAPPSVLGLRMEGGSAQMGSVETMMFVKSSKSLHTPVETVMGRALTLGCRLFGEDVYVWFRLDPIDLRPENEVEAFFVMRESRILDRLSLGMISDDEAAVELGCFPRPSGAPDLSGTMFRHKNPVETNPGDTPLGRDIQPDKDAPRRGGGRSN